MLMRTTMCLALVAAVAVAASDEPVDLEVKIKLLRQERVAVLTQLRDAVLALQEIGAAGGGGEQVYQAETDLLRARLELATTRQERIQLHEELLAKTAKWLAFVTELNHERRRRRIERGFTQGQSPRLGNAGRLGAGEGGQVS